jgi:hypothetical protein
MSYRYTVVFTDGSEESVLMNRLDPPHDDDASQIWFEDLCQAAEKQGLNSDGIDDWYR